MKTFFRSMASRFFALLAAFALAWAPGGAQAQTAYVYSQQELDQMLAPIALYPDALLSQILMAATYPMEVIEAARWARERPDLSGDAAVRAAETETWDPSVKSLLAIPQILARMRENLQWTLDLGDAFLEQEPEVMDTVQALRHKARTAGNLRSDDRVGVVESGPNLQMQPLDPQVVHVPYYDPQVVYGSWWWPAHPPMYLRPWPVHYARPAYAGGIRWAPPVRISPGFFFGAIDWRRREVRAHHVSNTYYSAPARQAHANPPASVNRPGAWQRDADHGRGPAYRSIPTQQLLDAASAPPDRGHPAREPGLVRPLNANRVESRPERHANPQPARFEPSPRLEIPRPHQPRMEVRPAPSPVRQDPAHMAASRHEPAARHPMPHAGAPRGDIRPAPTAARQNPGARSTAQPRMGR